MMLLTLLAAFITGFLASLGVGGGTILIIWLTAVCGMDQITAQGINLIFFLPIALLSVIIHIRNGLIDLKRLTPALLWGTPAAALAAFAASGTDSVFLGKAFSCFILLLGLKTLFGSKG